MTGFTLGSNFELQETKNLYDVAKSELGFLSPDPPVENLEKLRGNIKGAFSCCERKLIAYQKVYNPVQPDSNSKRKVILYVSKQPCLNCYLALDKWIVNDKISLTIDYPEQHNATYLHN
jgi:hypothetical protein